MRLSPDLYRKFLQGHCTADEEQAIREYLKEHPEELERIMDEAQWNDFKAAQRLHPAVSGKMFGRIGKSLQRRKRLYSLARYAAVTAGVIVMLSAAWMLTRNATSPVKMAAVRPVADTVPFSVHHNSGAKAQVITLEDSSVVALEKGGTIRYRKGFGGSRRDIWLSGAARFDVAKDVQRPFTVISRNVATTAIGTAFRVAEVPGKNKVTVRLFNGKVVIRPYGTSQQEFAEQYLAPGETWQYAAGKTTVIKAVKETLPDKPVIQEDGDTGLIFRQQPLAIVLKRLGQRFGRPVTFNEKDILNIRVTAEFNETETLEEIINSIADLNGLTVEQTGNGLHLKK